MSMKKFFIIKIALSMLLCVALVSPVIAQINQSTVNPEAYETIVIPETYNVPDLYLYQSTWLVQDTIRLRELTIAERAVLKAPEGKYLTLSVNGIGKQMQPGTYKGDVVLSVTDNCFEVSTGMGFSRNFHTAVLIDNGKLVPKKSTRALVLGGELTDTKAEGIYIGSEEESFNGIMVDGDSEYTINNVKIDLDGFGDCDFTGVGSAVRTGGNSKVTINDSVFNVNGVTRCALHVGGNSVVTLNNCKLFRYSPDTDWVNKFFSWQVGFRGTGRVAQLADYGTVYYNNCYIKGNGTWCLLSIDNATKVKIVVKDSTCELDGPRSHGYGVFCIGSQEVTYDHSTFDVNGYPLFMMGTQGLVNIINGSVLKGRRFGIFCCSDNNSVVNIKDSTIRTEKSNLCIKGSAITFNIDNSVMNAKNGVIVQLMDSEESGMNQLEYRIPVGVVDKAVPGRDLTTASPTEDVKINIANSKIQGNFFNSTTNIHAEKGNPTTDDMGTFHDTVVGTGASQAQQAAISGGRGMGMGSAPEGEGMGQSEGAKDQHGPKNLALNFTNVRINGIISSATQAYKEGLTVIGPETREELSNVTQTAAETVNNGVIVSLDKDSVWIVTGTSYITALTLAKGAEVKAPEGKSLTMLVNGKKTDIKADTYTGKIQMVVF